MEKDVASSENLQEEEQAFQDVHMTEKDLKDGLAQPKKQRRPQRKAKATNRTTF